MEQIEAAVVRASRLTEQLLAFGRRIGKNTATVAVNKLVEETVELMSRTIPKMISLRTELDPDLKTIQADPGQLSQVLINLILNARDAMETGGALTIRTEPGRGDRRENGRNGNQDRPDQAGEYIRLSVGDTGQGMDEATLSHIFEPFFTTKPLGKGNGLGLSTAYGIIKSHGGWIDCFSQPGQGSTFVIYLPVQDRPAEQAADPIRRPSQAGRGSGTILLVDDERSIRDTAGEYLRQSGFTILQADSGERALEVFNERARDIDLIIMDLGMPGMGGQKCLEEILRLDDSAKIIVASGYTADNQAQRAVASGAAKFIGKPYRFADLSEAVTEVLDQA